MIPFIIGFVAAVGIIMGANSIVNNAPPTHNTCQQSDPFCPRR